MIFELVKFQRNALDDLHAKTNSAMRDFQESHTPQVVSFSAPTGSGKTIIMGSLMEDIFFGCENFMENPQAIFVWLSDSPQLNQQSKDKIDLRSDKIRLEQCITIEDDSFDQEMLDDGRIYFLNTQKLSVSANLTKHGDSRTYTIWETLANTAREKNDRLYFIIDEAHRGMQGREAEKATSIMQKFLKGSPEDGIDPMPVVIGMSATTGRFEEQVNGIGTTIRKCIVTPDEVRESGLLKDRIIITYPEEGASNNEMAILQAAADDYKEKCEHWAQYCREGDYSMMITPVLVVQVLNGTGDTVTITDLGDCLSKIEDRLGYEFNASEVVHTFGQTNAPVTANGMEITYEEPSRISDNENIKVVFFKENLSTGWDCPRAETMMSFRPARDATYIAQLLGRMIRTPMHRRVSVDDVLNDVHLFLPHFNRDTVQQVVNELQHEENGELPADVISEPSNHRVFSTLTVNPHTTRHTPPVQLEGQASISDVPVTQNMNNSRDLPKYTNAPQLEEQPAPEPEPDTNENTDVQTDDLFDRRAVHQFINDAGLLSYDIRKEHVNDYKRSLFDLAHLLNQSAICTEVVDEVNNEVVDLIHDYIDRLKENGQYDEVTVRVKKFELREQTFDPFGAFVDNHTENNLFGSTDTDIDRQFRAADHFLGSNGINIEYGRVYGDESDPLTYKIDVILFVNDSECIANLNAYAERKFHDLTDRYRNVIAVNGMDDVREEFRKIIRDGDAVSKHTFELPETIDVLHDSDGNECTDHLFVNEETGTACFNLNTWEKGVLEEERKRDDFVCWIRNPQNSGSSWALTIPYEQDNVMKPTYPDLIIVRKDDTVGYQIDILEPHGPQFTDGLGKSKGYAKYMEENPRVSRMQIIREGRDGAGQTKFIRLDLAKSEVRQAVSQAVNSDELDHLFDTMGVVD